MTIARAQATFGRAILRRSGTQTRTQAWKRIARRGYADSGHASPDRAQKSSDLPWMIGSVALTVPAAVWLFNQGPKRGGVPHGPGEAEHERDEHDKDEEEPAEEGEVAIRGETAPAKGKKVKEGSGESEEENSDMTSKDDQEADPSTKEGGDEDKAAEDSQEGKEEGEDKSTRAEKEDKKDAASQEADSEDKQDKPQEKSEGQSDDKPEGKDDQSDDSSSDEDSGKNTPDTSDDESSGERKKDKDGYELPGPNAPGQINWKSSSGKGPGEGQKGTRRAPELAGERQSSQDHSGAQNPYLDDHEKSKKGEGVKETAKIHGTVDSNRPAR